MSPPVLPRLFIFAGEKRRLWALGALTLLSGLAQLPAIATMSAHGASLTAFELAGSVSRSRQILADWGPAGKDAMWWQLAFDTAFLVGYGLLLAGACTLLSRRAEAAGRPRLQGAAAIVAWFGPIAAAADLLQNVSLALVLAGHVAQPWPRISALCGVLTVALMVAVVLFVTASLIATRTRRAGTATAASGERG